MARGEVPVPLHYCPQIQAFTGNEVTCEELRPDQSEHFALIRSLRPRCAGDVSEIHAPNVPTDTRAIHGRDAPKLLAVTTTI